MPLTDSVEVFTRVRVEGNPRLVDWVKMSVADGDDKSAYRTSDVPYFPENGVVGNYVSPSRSANAADIEISGSGFWADDRQYGSYAERWANPARRFMR